MHLSCLLEDLGNSRKSSFTFLARGHEHLKILVGLSGMIPSGWVRSCCEKHWLEKMYTKFSQYPLVQTHKIQGQKEWALEVGRDLFPGKPNSGHWKKYGLAQITLIDGYNQRKTCTTSNQQNPARMGEVITKTHSPYWEELLAVDGCQERRHLLSSGCRPWIHGLVDDSMPVHILITLNELSGFKQKEYRKWEVCRGKQGSEERGWMNLIETHYMCVWNSEQ